MYFDMVRLIRPDGSGKVGPMMLQELEAVLGPVLEQIGVDKQQALERIDKWSLHGAKLSQLCYEFGAGYLFYFGDQLSENLCVSLTFIPLRYNFELTIDPQSVEAAYRQRVLSRRRFYAPETAAPKRESRRIGCPEIRRWSAPSLQRAIQKCSAYTEKRCGAGIGNSWSGCWPHGRFAGGGGHSGDMARQVAKVQVLLVRMKNWSLSFPNSLAT